MSYYENRIKALEEKVAEMARMQRHKAIPVEAKLVERIAEYQAENTRLKAEVERLEQQVNYWLIEAETDNARWLRCLKDLEAVRKMGDAMLFFIEKKTHAEVYAMIAKEWKEAKEGNQP